MLPFFKPKKGFQLAGSGLDAGSSGGGGIDTSALANKTDLTVIILTGTTNTSDGTITAGTWFYLNGTPCVAKVDIASGATFTEGTNYEEKTIGSALSELNSRSPDSKYVDFQNKTFNQVVSELTSRSVTHIMQASSYTPTDLPEGVTPNQWNIEGIVMKHTNTNYYAIISYTGVSPAKTWAIMDGVWINIA